jgi:hypothetical protein
MRSQTNTAWHLVVTQLGGWKALLVLIPVGLIVVLLAGLMFALFASVLVVGSAALAIRLWWLKRKLAQPSGPQTLEGDYVVLERHTEVIEATPDRHKRKE